MPLIYPRTTNKIIIFFVKTENLISPPLYCRSLFFFQLTTYILKIKEPKSCGSIYLINVSHSNEYYKTRPQYVIKYSG
jgi:hypothetical protein